MQTGRSFFLCLFVALIASFALTSKPAAPDLQTALLHTTLQTILPPTEAAKINAQPTELQAQFIDYAARPALLAKARLALQTHPQIAPDIFIHHGAEADFQAVLEKYGEDVLLPIQHFRNNELKSLYWMLHAPEKVHALFAAQEAIKEMADQNAAQEQNKNTQKQTAEKNNDSDTVDQPPAQPPFSLNDPIPADSAWSANIRGRLAIYFLQDEGYAFMAQFQTNDPAQKHITRDQTKSILDNIGLSLDSTTGKITLNTATANTPPLKDYSLATLSQIGAVRALALAPVTSADNNHTQKQTNTSAPAQSVLQMYINRYLALCGPLLHTSTLAASSPKLALFALPILHPQLLDSTLTSLAQTFSLPVSMVRFIGWLLLFFILAWFARFLLSPLLALLTLINSTLRGLQRWLNPSARPYR